MTTIGEGIETPAQLYQLAALGCDLGQGFYIGRPAAVADRRRSPLAGAKNKALARSAGECRPFGPPETGPRPEAVSRRVGAGSEEDRRTHDHVAVEGCRPVRPTGNGSGTDPSGSHAPGDARSRRGSEMGPRRRSSRPVGVPRPRRTRPKRAARAGRRGPPLPSDRWSDRRTRSRRSAPRAGPRRRRDWQEEAVILVAAVADDAAVDAPQGGEKLA